MNKTAELRFELESLLENKIIFKKEWLTDPTEEQEEMFQELYEHFVEGKYGAYPFQIVGYEDSTFICIDRDDLGAEQKDIKEYYVDYGDVDLETLEWFIKQPSI
jgi:hypothetical protein